MSDGAIHEKPGRRPRAKTGGRRPPVSPVCVCDKPNFDRAMRELDDDICDCAFAVQYIWRSKYRTEICFRDGAAFTPVRVRRRAHVRLSGRGGSEKKYRGDRGAVRGGGEALQLGLLSEKMKAMLERNFRRVPVRGPARQRRLPLRRAQDDRSAGAEAARQAQLYQPLPSAYEGRWQFEPFDPEKLDELYDYEAAGARQPHLRGRSGGGEPGHREPAGKRPGARRQGWRAPAGRPGDRLLAGHLHHAAGVLRPH